jgi:hypothetical protein
MSKAPEVNSEILWNVALNQYFEVLLIGFIPAFLLTSDIGVGIHLKLSFQAARLRLHSSI